MKLRILLFTLTALVLAACHTKPSPTTSLIIQFSEDRKVWPVQILNSSLDTVLTVPQETRTAQIDLPTDILAVTSVLAGSDGTRIILDGTPLTLLFPPKGDAVITSAQPKKSIQTSYSAFDSWMKEFMKQYKADQEAITGNKTLSKEQKQDQQEALLQTSTVKLNDYCRKVVAGNKDNILSLIALGNMEIEDKEMATLIAGLGEGVRSLEPVRKMKETIDIRLETAEGRMFKDFTVVQNPGDPEKTTVRFSDFIGSGKYVLVDFWASWCGPCRREIPMLKAIYDEFAGERFDLLSIAVWDRPEATEKAAEELGITWNQIINAQQIPTTLYGIETIPHIILFGPDGTILHRNLRGEKIREAVAGALK